MSLQRMLVNGLFYLSHTNFLCKIELCIIYTSSKARKIANLYIGSTNDLKKRFAEHNNGKVFSTKHRKPFKLIYYEAYSNEKDARMREHNLKLRSRAFAQLKKRIKRSLEE